MTKVDDGICSEEEAEFMTVQVYLAVQEVTAGKSGGGKILLVQE